MTTQTHKGTRGWRRVFLTLLCGAAFVLAARAQTLHRIGAEVRPVAVLPTHPFFKEENSYRIPIDRSWSFHLKYAFQNPRHTWAPTAWQGIGVSYHRFLYARTPRIPGDGLDATGSPILVPLSRRVDELGSPTAVYLFQGAQIARLGPRLSLDYEWNFGLSFGWKPYDFFLNGFNKVIGSKINAYLNADFFLHYRLSRALGLTAGLSAAHFSNGNTALPNAGLNTLGLTFGAVYRFERQAERQATPPPPPDVDPARRGVSYEAILFGAWRKKWVRHRENLYGSPHSYGVTGFSAAAMVNWGDKIRVGGSLDGVYDSSANIYMEELLTDFSGGGESYRFITPPWSRQWALGVAVQADYVMPYFTLTAGFGANVLHGGGEMKSFYQKLALKIDLTPRTFLHIGYSLREFRAPNYLMLGVGMRFK